MLGLDKHPYGLNENEDLVFEEKKTNSPLWKAYNKHRKDPNKILIDFQLGKYTLEDTMQFTRELGVSLQMFIDWWSNYYYIAEDMKKFKIALDRLKETTDLKDAQQEILDSIFLAHLDETSEDVVINYRLEAKKIINANFGYGAWAEFVESIRNKNE